MVNDLSRLRRSLVLVLAVASATAGCLGGDLVPPADGGGEPGSAVGPAADPVPEPEPGPEPDDPFLPDEVEGEEDNESSPNDTADFPLPAPGPRPVEPVDRPAVPSPVAPTPADPEAAA